jgi:thiol-disulfide isomerase/thioredoxin
MALAGFAKLAAGQSVVTPESKWVSFGGTQPGLVPAGTEDSTQDLVVYENVMAMVETAGKPQAVTVGTMVRVGDTWRLIDLPNMSESAAEPLFFAMPRADRGEGAVVGKPSEQMQKLMDELHKLGDIGANSTPQQHERRAELLAQLAEESDTPENRAQWYRQLADSLSAAVQTSGYEAGIEKLKQLYERLQADGKDAELAAYVQYRYMTAEHGHELSQPNADFAKIQDKWIKDLKAFIEGGDNRPDSAEAMMELAIAQEFGGEEDEAIKWYESVAQASPNSPFGQKAAGAKLRLSSVGKSIPLKGRLITGQAYDLERLKGKAVLIQYWVTWCEPCKADMPLLKELRTKYKDFEVVGVCLDNQKQDMLAFLKENDPKWPQLYEEGGLDSRYANELGIQTLPTMILIDKQGKVVNRNIRSTELDTELKRVLK